MRPTGNEFAQNFSCYDQLTFINQIKGANLTQRLRPHSWPYFSFAFNHFLSLIGPKLLSTVPHFMARDGFDDLGQLLRSKPQLFIQHSRKVLLPSHFANSISEELKPHFRYYRFNSTMTRGRRTKLLMVFPLHDGKINRHELSQLCVRLSGSPYKFIHILFTRPRNSLVAEKNDIAICENFALKLNRSVRLISMESLYRRELDLKQADFFYARSIDHLVSDCFIRFMLLRAGAQEVWSSIEEAVKFDRIPLSFHHELRIMDHEHVL